MAHRFHIAGHGTIMIVLCHEKRRSTYRVSNTSSSCSSFCACFWSLSISYCTSMPLPLPLPLPLVPAVSAFESAGCILMVGMCTSMAGEPSCVPSSTINWMAEVWAEADGTPSTNCKYWWRDKSNRKCGRERERERELEHMTRRRKSDNSVAQMHCTCPLNAWRHERYNIRENMRAKNIYMHTQLPVDPPLPKPLAPCVLSLTL